jgi:hypothetical protein
LAFVHHVRDQVRSLLRIRRERVAPPLGNKPGVGARIACGDLRMTVQAGMSDGLWKYLTRKGWREVLYRPDRRRYRDLPHTLVTRLIDAAPEDRDRILALATTHASVRTPTAGGRSGGRSDPA